ncbi:MAG: Asp-tRNA(Asn)/Glu-tRNA(Gln) amidotransferase subunit GatB [Elusimicrobiota bacterium]|nr:Asp-tRNA(Asn)/Glu-tRNA(Gln) amidotransferase subunit GatB [Elusimicrobiota bacterium]
MYQSVIGLEVHVQLKTKSKMFCSCPVEFGAPPNTNICPICTGQPGVLPVANKKAIELSLKTAQALNCKVNRRAIFVRKNYFYPDLPKNYQISQYEQPFAIDGSLEIELKDGKKKSISIKRVHLEEDTGKLLHAIGSTELNYSLVDFNRAGTPLLEIVSEPQLYSPEEAYIYLHTLKTLLQYIDVSDCDMEKGSFRCDANVSVSPPGFPLGTKTEIKNMNSFKSVTNALTYEINRQSEVLNSGEKIIQETRLWNEKNGITESMRYKEEAHDYRYFPEPDLLPFEFSDEFLDKIKSTIPLLPKERKEKFIKDYALSDYDAGILTSDKKLADYYELGIAHHENSQQMKQKQSPGLPPAAILKFAKPFANWVIVELLGRLNAKDITIDGSPVSAERLAALVEFIIEQKISNNIAKDVLDEMFATGKGAEEIIAEKGLLQIVDAEVIEKIIDEVIKENAKAVGEYKSGKKQVFGALVGAVMKKTSGRANPEIVNKILKSKLG